MKFKTDSMAVPVRLDIFLSEELKLSRNRIQKLIKDGRVTVQGLKRVSNGFKLKGGSVADVDIPASTAILPENIPLDIVYEDADILILNKKAGMIVHPAPKVRSGTLVNALIFRWGRSFVTGSPERPGIVHRLDKDTSGVMVAAKNDNAYYSLVKQFGERKIHKKYISLVSGCVKQDSRRRCQCGEAFTVRGKRSPREKQ
jgi:23S rRNA pseudouridine1911/1915/1917 synthase